MTTGETYSLMKARKSNKFGSAGEGKRTGWPPEFGLDWGSRSGESLLVEPVMSDKQPGKSEARANFQSVPRAQNRRAFWDRYPGLVWSNRNAPDDAFIAAALRKGRFLELLDVAVEFGVGRLLTVWEAELACDDLPAGVVRRAEQVLSILKEANERVVATRNGESVATS